MKIVQPKRLFEALDSLRKYLNTTNRRQAISYARLKNTKQLTRTLKYLLSKTRINTAETFFLENLLKVATESDKACWRQVTNCYDIIVPVFNQKECVHRLFTCILSNTRQPYRLIVVDDYSTDPTVSAFIRELSRQFPHIIYLRNESNCGFVRSVNRAYEYVQNNFVILNTDVEVPPNWLERLMYPIWRRSDIASTTPFTNAGTICSFPRFLEDNHLFQGLPLAAIDEYFQRIRAEEYVSLPTGVGFCMGVNKRVVEEIGLFDEETFGRGYCEENDWCMRAYKRGYRNVIVPNLYVWHKHGGSFDKEEKRELFHGNFGKLESKHPEYSSVVNDFIRKDPLKSYRELLILLISANVVRQLVLIIDHNLGGGANEYRNKAVRAIVNSGGGVLLLVYDFYRKKYKISYHQEKYNVKFGVRNVWSLESLMSQHIKKLETIIVNGLVSFEAPLEMLELLKAMKVRHNALVRVAVHDYFCICPNYVLLNQKYEYCEIPQEDEICMQCIRANEGDFKIFMGGKCIDVQEWRKQWGTFLKNAEEIVCFSYASKKILTTAYPFLNAANLQISMHTVDYVRPVVKRGIESHKLRIGIIGSINLQKGAKIVKDMATLLEKEKRTDVELVILGRINEWIKARNVVVTGEYRKEDLCALVEKYKIDVVLIPSIWPETFSYVTEETMKMGLPVAVFDIGAPAERVARYPKGLVIRRRNAKGALEAILSWKASGGISGMGI